MKKVLSLLFAAFILSAICITPFYAAPKGAKVVDDSGYFTAQQTAALTNKLTETGNKYDMDLVVVLVPSLQGKSKVVFADDYYDYNGYKKDGCLLLLCIDDREWYISTTGYGITAFTDYGIDCIGEQIKPELKAKNYYGACDKYADLCDDFISEAKKGTPYDTNHKYKDAFDYFFGIAISLVVGIVIALVVALGIKSKYKPVRLKAEANDYIVQGSLNVRNGYDNFLYTHVSRTRREKSSGGGSSTHTSSSGTSHGGGGGSW